MKTQTKQRRPRTQFVLVNAELQANNLEVEKAFDKITMVASELIKKFDLPKFRTTILVDHTKDEQNVNLVREYINHFWNITLSANKDGRLYIFIDIDQDGITRFGSGLTNTLLRNAFKITESVDNTPGIEYAMRVNYIPSAIHPFFYRRIVEGETDTVSIFTEEKAVA